MARWKELGWEFCQDIGEPPTLSDECHGMFNDHSESGPWFNTSSEEWHLTLHRPHHCTGALDYNIRTSGKTVPYWPSNTTSSSNVFPGGLQSRYEPILHSAHLLIFSHSAETGYVLVWLLLHFPKTTGLCWF